MSRAMALSGLVVFAVLAVVTGTAGATGVKKGTRGVLEVEYVLTGKGSQTVGGTDHSDWRVARSLSFRVVLAAGEFQNKPVSTPLVPMGAHSPAARLGGVSQKHQGSLGRVEAETAKCKHDADCEARVAMDFMMSGEGAAVVNDMQQAARTVVADRPRYQYWSALDAAGKLIGATGTYKIDEYSKTVTYDPLCGKTQDLCTTVRELKGEGDLAFGDLFTQEVKLGGVVVDDQLGFLSLALPTPYTFGVDVRENVQSTQSGQRSRQLSLRVLDLHQKTDKFGVAEHKIVSPLREERGEATIPLVKALYGSDGSMTIRWRFALVP